MVSWVSAYGPERFAGKGRLNQTPLAPQPFSFTQPLQGPALVVDDPPKSVSQNCSNAYRLGMASTNENIPNTNAYGADSIKVLKGLDAVRKRPGMYIGDTDDGSGLHHMVFEVSDNAIDEALAGHCDLVLIELNPDGSVSVEDNGRGIPTGIHAGEGVSAAEVIMTQLHAGGKFENTSDDNAYKVSGGLHGVGVSVVNALSEWLELTIWRDGEEHWMRFEHGDAVAPLVKRGAGAGVWTGNGQDRDQEGHKGYLHRLDRHLQECARIRLRQARTPLPRAGLSQFRGAGAAARFCAMRRSRSTIFITRAGSALSSNISIATRCRCCPIRSRFRPSAEGIAIEVALEWNDSYYENVLCFTNNIPQRDGGTHLAAFRAALTPHAQQLRREIGAIEEGKGQPDRRGHARRADRDRLG